MKRFKEKLVVSLENDGKHWTLEEEFIYYTDVIDRREYIYVPKGFTTDFASIPKIFHSFISDKDKYNKASVVHDWLYSSKRFNRKIADKIFLEAMTVLNIHPIKRYIFYYAVRLFGWMRFNK